MYRFREPVSGFTHLGGALFAIIGLVWLIGLTRDDTAKMITMVIYGVTTIIVYLASASLHLFNGSKKNIFRLRKVDHAAIYLVIAGTYTPFFYLLLNGGWRWGMLGFIWVMATAGMVYKLFFMKDGSHLSTVVYVLLGWSCILVAPMWLPQLPSQAVSMILLSGIIYTVGAVIFALDRPNFHRHFGAHEIWHLFVLAGSSLTFATIAQYLV